MLKRLRSKERGMEKSKKVRENVVDNKNYLR